MTPKGTSTKYPSYYYRYSSEILNIYKRYDIGENG